MLNLFYEEPNPDRWIPFDRYPRQLVRRIVRGPAAPGGQMRVFLNLCAGLTKIGVRYRVNDYRYIRRHTSEIACIIGKPQVLDRIKCDNPIIFGSALFSHPIDRPGLLTEFTNVRRVLVPGEWMRQMFAELWGDVVMSWPVGIDTESWNVDQVSGKRFDFLLYDKVRWTHEEYEQTLLEPIRRELRRRGLSFVEIRYGHYREENFRALLRECRAMIFLCEHETQGIAYQQALSCGVPILAWDRRGFWQDPSYYPHRIQFREVTSVPYWDERCGLTFAGIEVFNETLSEFLAITSGRGFAPRSYILENLTLEECARRYLEIVRE
jgi:hypothetical protein